MIAAVLDTNVLASALLRRGGIPDTILRNWRRRAFQLVLSEHILTELAALWSNLTSKVACPKARRSAM